MLINITKLERILKKLIVENHKTTLMALNSDKMLKKLEYSSVAQMRNNILEKSPLFIFARMSLPAFFVNNQYVTKNAEFNTEEQDVLLTLAENLRFEFGDTVFEEIIKKNAVKDSYSTETEYRIIVCAYIYALNKDIINIEAENVAIEYLRNINSFSLNV